MRRYLFGFVIAASACAVALGFDPAVASAATENSTARGSCTGTCQHGSCSADMWFKACTCTCDVQGLPHCSCGLT